MAKSRSKSLFDSEEENLLEFNPKLLCKSWQELEQHTSNCHGCVLSKSRTQVVSGRYSTSKSADLLIVGEGPGQNEDKQGLAFVGDSGELLDIMLDSVGLDSWYITNVVRCRPPNNRNPTKAECSSCFGYLQSEIALVEPKVILCLGKIAAKAIIGSSAKFEKLMRSSHRYFEYPVWVAYHPAFLLRNPQMTKFSPKWEVWQILCQIKLYLGGLRLNGNE